MNPLIRMQDISKEFPGVLANNSVNLEIYPGEVLGLLGENGAGKTTLMNILYGLYRPTSGKIFVRDKEVRFNSPRAAIENGISMIHQHFMLIPVHTVVENIMLSSRHDNKFFPNWQLEEKLIADFSSKYGLSIDLTAKVESLPLVMQQRLEIIKSLYYGADLLIMDEPTGVLTPQEVDDLLHVLRRLAKDGLAIVFITHKLREVMVVSDRIAVLRGGRKIGEVATKETNEKELVQMMVGREVLFDIDRRHTVGDKVVMRVENISVKDERGQLALQDVSFSVNTGEIVGIAGIDGNGQRELAETIIGIRSLLKGRIEVLGRETSRLSTAQIHQLGVGIIPEDRRTSGLLLTFTLEENLVLEQHDQAPFSRYGILQPRVIKQHALELIDEYSIQAPSPKVHAAKLSGGNQQKIVLARALASNPQLIVASQPTRGLDIGATEYVRQKLVDQACNGQSVLLISTELDEIMMLSDRIIVLYEGRIMGNVLRKDATRDVIGLMMAGKRQDEVI